MDISLLTQSAVPLAVALSLVAVLALALFYQRSDFVIRVRRGSVECRGRVPLSQTRGLSEFLLEDLAVRDRVTIRGRWQNGRLRVSVHGALTEGQRQRVRNFLLTRL
jgi:hypothetical protein